MLSTRKGVMNPLPTRKWTDGSSSRKLRTRQSGSRVVDKLIKAQLFPFFVGHMLSGSDFIELKMAAAMAGVAEWLLLLRSQPRQSRMRATNVAQLRAHQRINLRNQLLHFTKGEKTRKKSEKDITWFVNFALEVKRNYVLVLQHCERSEPISFLFVTAME